MIQRKRLAALAIAAIAAVGLVLFSLGSAQRSASEGQSAGAATGAPAGGPSGAKKGKGAPGGMGGAFGASQESSAKTVRAKAAVVTTLRPYIDQGGDVETSVSVSVYPDIGGRLAGLEGALGDSGAKGQEIAGGGPLKPRAG
jgi:hypothetical protein